MGIETNSVYGYAGNHAGNGENSTDPDLPSKKRKSRTLLATTSAAMLSVALASGASAQTVPTGCDPSTAINGSAIICVVASPDTIDPIETNVDDLTITIGDDTTPTTVNDDTVPANAAIEMVGGGAQTLNIINSGSNVTGSTDAIKVEITGGTGDLAVNVAGSINAGDDGLDIDNAGFGSTVVSVASVYATSDDGIDIDTDLDSGDVRVGATGHVDGGDEGIDIFNYGYGSVTVTTAQVTGRDGDGIFVYSYGDGDIAIDSTGGTVSGDNDGISASSDFGGDVSISAASVTGENRIGIYGYSWGGSISITSLTGAINGGEVGIFADAEGPAGGDISIETGGNVSGGEAGIVAFGFGAINIDANAVSNSDANGRDGIYAKTEDGAGDITISANQVTSRQYGIQSYQYGTGSNSVTVGTVSTTLDDGIYALNDTEAGDLTVTATGLVTAGDDGFEIRNNGIGATGIYADAISAIDDGIEIDTAATTTSVTVVTSGDIAGEAGDGIDVNHLGTGAVAVTVANVTGGDTGIRTVAATGTTTITLGSTAVVTGRSGAGIDASSTGALAAITVQGSSGDVIGATDG
ncbi:hypothetical protein, partial [Parasphingorhabdus sp.]|uniref:beta strand repeat-containing protein n=1 Tax=Parasphingorhabdus sp. TaxID=2709688 RepID=UPI00326359AC